MANKVYSTEEVELLNGDVLELKPLPIKRLRKFMAKMEEFPEANDQYEMMDTVLEAARMCLLVEYPELTKDQDSFEEVMDMDTAYKILEVCGGIKLNDPEALAAAAATAVAMARGTRD